MTTPTAAAPPSPLATPEPWDLVSGAYAEEIVPQFELFAADALRLADVTAGSRVLDVACGPGTLSLLAARRGAKVDAIDFSAGMVERLRARLAQEKIDGVTVQVGDGQKLPFADAQYDAAFSMFGLMFFPDRDRGFRELRRCLRDGGVAVVSGWQPMEANVPFCAGIFAALRARMPNLPFGGQESPLSKQDVFRDEMTAAGFRDVVVHEVRHEFTMPSTAEGWASMRRTMAPLAMLSKKMGPAWAALDEQLLGDLVAKFGSGPQVLSMPAWLGVGKR
jgi:ubiquinone/menaquinone biosynthesis C-methylase UbiE